MPTIRSDAAPIPTGLGRIGHEAKRLLTLVPLPLRRHLFYLRHLRTWGNFRNPTHYNEKVQWRIINDRRTWLTVACDKLASKEYVWRIAIEQQLPLRIPETFWAGTDVRELYALRDKLPARWVLKPNHSSGRYRLLDANDEAIDWNDLIAAGDRWMRPDEETGIRGHFGYVGARKMIFAEERVGLGTESATIRFNGNSRGITDAGVTVGVHGIGTHKTFAHDRQLRRVPSERSIGASMDERSIIEGLSPEGRESLRAIGTALCAGFDQIRADVYVFEGVWFGEFTAYSASGLTSFGPKRMKGWSDNWVLPDLSVADPREPLWRELLAREERGTLQGQALQGHNAR